MTHHCIQIVGSGFSGFNTGNETIVTLHICHLNRVQSDGSVEICKCNDEEHEHEIVKHTRMIKELIEEPASSVFSSSLCKCQRDEHDCLCKDDRHHISCEKFHRNVLTSTTYRTVTFNTFSILNRNFTSGFDQGDCKPHYEEQSNNLKEELDETTTFGTT